MAKWGQARGLGSFRLQGLYRVSGSVLSRFGHFASEDLQRREKRGTGNRCSRVCCQNNPRLSDDFSLVFTATICPPDSLVYQIAPLPTAPRMLRYSGRHHATPIALRCRLLCHLINVQGCIQQCEALHLRPEPQAWKCEVPVKRRFHLKPWERFCKLQEVALRWNASRHCRSCSWAAGVCALPFLLLLL